MVAGVFESRGFWEVIAWTASAVAVWAQAHIPPKQDPVDDLMERVRHPLRWSLKHPWQAMKRTVDEHRGSFR